MPERQHMSVLIIGAGPAGCTAAIQLQRWGINFSLLDRSGIAGGLLKNAWRIENYPGLEKALRGKEFCSRLDQQLAGFDIQIIQTECQAIIPDRDTFAVQSSPWGELQCTSVILACGTESRCLEQLTDDCFYEPHTLLDARDNGHVAIIGGSEAAYDYALSMASSNWHVDLLVRAQTPRANQHLLAAVNQNTAINMHTQTELTNARRDDQGRMQLSTTRGSITVDEVLIAIGRRSGALTRRSIEIMASSPSFDIGEKGALQHAAAPKEGKGKFRPSVTPLPLTVAPGFFIAGDARLGSLGQAGIAVGDGLQAARLAVEYLEQLG